MESGERKHTWVHVTYDPDNTIEVIFVTDRWQGKQFIGRHKRRVCIERQRWVRMARLVRLLSYSACVRYTIFAWNGFSVSYERRSGQPK